MQRTLVVLLTVILAGPLVASCATRTAASAATPTVQLTEDFPEAVRAVLGSLSSAQALPLTQIKVVAYQQVSWSNACLELPQPQEVCAAVETPGWLIVLNAAGEQLEVHADGAGQNIRFR
ncbi:MAG TPA: hypothetical protein VJG32_08015 [Anaerolineae bacterium]|nr:hypothetical protein [Anaerolineae bacterium]